MYHIFRNTITMPLEHNMQSRSITSETISIIVDIERNVTIQRNRKAIMKETTQLSSVAWVNKRCNLASRGGIPYTETR